MPTATSLFGLRTMRPETAGQRSRRQTVTSGAPPEPKPNDIDKLGTSLGGDSKLIDELQNELEFLQWYGGVEDELLEASYDEYQ